MLLHGAAYPPQRPAGVSSHSWQMTAAADGQTGPANLSLHKQILIQPAGLSAGFSPHSFWIPSFLPFSPLITSKIMKGQLCSISLVKCKNLGGNSWNPAVWTRSEMAEHQVGTRHILQASSVNWEQVLLKTSSTTGGMLRNETDLQPLVFHSLHRILDFCCYGVKRSLLLFYSQKKA